MDVLPVAVTRGPSRRLTWKEFREASKARFALELRERYSLRLHAVVILCGSVLAGALASALALQMGMQSMPGRYLLGFGVAYLSFLGLVRLWIDYVGGWRPEPDLPNPLDFCDPFPHPCRSFQGGEGRFGGGGSGGSWGESRGPSSGSDGESSAFGLDLDDGILILVLAALALVLLGGVFYFVAVGPAVLTEAAFEVFLAGALAGRFDLRTDGRWLDHTVGSTIVPFLAVAALTAALALFVQELCPAALKLRDVLQCIG